MPCPIGTLPIVEPDQRSGGSTIPPDSPGKSTPVGLPKPKRPIQDATRSLPSSCASVIVPMFDDWKRICATLIVCVGRGSCSWMTRSATRMVGASRNFELGATSFSARAAATVTSLKVEPGSYVSVIARLRTRAARAVPNLFASKEGAFAMARIAPVRGSRTTAVAPFAFHC